MVVLAPQLKHILFLIKKKLFRLIANFTNNIVVVCSSHDSFDNTLVCTLVLLFLFKHF